MNYLKIYNNIMALGKINRDITYTEEHHIIPKCMGGLDDKENITSLSPKEHYIAHLLLTKIYPTNKSLLSAFGMMSLISPNHKRQYTAIQYDKMKRAYSDRMKQNNPMHNPETAKKVSQTKRKNYKSDKNPGKTKNSREKAKQRWTGENNPSFKNKERLYKPVLIKFHDNSERIFSHVGEAEIVLGVSKHKLRHLIKNKKKNDIIKDIQYVANRYKNKF